MSRKFWLLAAQLKRETDLTADFIQKGMWTTDHLTRFFIKINSMRDGDRVALKSHFSKNVDGEKKRKWAIRIKRIGTVTRNFMNGHVIFVKWDDEMPPKDIMVNQSMN